MKKFISTFAIVFLTVMTAWSQVYVFSAEPNKFQNEIRTFYKGIKIEKTEKIVNDFLALMKEEAYTPEEFLRIVATCNFMLKKRFKPMPYFQEYLEILVAYKKNRIDIVKFREWHEVYETQVNKTTRQLSLLNRSFLSLFSQNAIYSEQSKTWYIGTNNYSIGYDEEPFIRVNERITLLCITDDDSLVIHQTIGTYYPLEHKWVGNEGVVNWRRVELDSNVVQAKIFEYSLNTRISEVEADSAVFVNTEYFSQPLLGKYWDKALTRNLRKDAKYPKFRSYSAVYILDKLANNVLYIGGFSQEGRNMMGTSSMEAEGEVSVKARVLVSYKGKPMLKAESDIFMITPEKIIASNAQTTIYYEGDSFFHPQIIFNLFLQTRKLTLTRGESGMYRSPMFNTYHNLEMEFDQLEWMIDDPKIDFRLFFGSEGSAIFTSQDFYTLDRYMRVQGILEHHPLQKLREAAKRRGSDKIMQDDYAAVVGVRPEFVVRQLITLAMAGFILYDQKTGEIDIREKTYTWTNASSNRADYDLLRFESTIKRTNGYFSLESGNLHIEGVGFILLSDSHRVHVTPKEQRITIKKDRNFEFDGYVRGGLFEFFGNNFYFDYQNFKIDMTNIDSVRMYIRPDESAPTKIAQIKSVIQNVSGSLYIDHMKNKSGRISYPQYPIFECTKHAFVYYDHPHVLGGVYDRDKFYFEIEPFTVDSLYRFSSFGLQFDGTFYSGGIVPDFQYKLSPQPDFSLGFVKTDIYPNYINKQDKQGTAEIILSLSHRGLRGNGQIEYLTSITTSADFVYYFDSTRANAITFNLEHNAMGKYPKVVGEEVFMRWFPYADTMIIETRKVPFRIYEKAYEFSGNLVLTPQRLSSSGQFDYKNSVINSREFVFTPTELLSEDATVRIYSDNPNFYAFAAPHIKLNLNVETDIMNGESTKDEHQINFPLTRYQTSMKKFVWYNLLDSIAISPGIGQSDKSCYMLSTKSDQDSLQFQSTFAHYDLKKFILTADKIPYIPIADAWVYPFEGKALIERDAFMQTLKEARIRTDTINFYHNIYDALVNVFGKYKFAGYGNYEYVDKYKNVQELFFYQIRVDDNNRTYARCRIPDTIVFKPSPHFKFHGYIDMNSNYKQLDFDGFVYPDHGRPYMRTGWFAFHNRVDPDSVYFLLNIPKGKEGRELFTGVYLGTDSPYVYNLFMGYKKAFADYEVFSIKEGILFYDDKKESYVYSSLGKHYKTSTTGPLWVMNNVDGNIYGEGIFDFGDDIKAITIKTAGIYNYNTTDHKFLFDVVMTIDFPFDDKAITRMSDQIIQNGFFRRDIRPKNDVTLLGFSELVENESQRKTILNEIDQFGQIPITRSTTLTMVFTDVRMTYNMADRVFQTDEKTFGLVNLKRTNINKQMGGGMQITRRRSGTMFNLYIECDKYTTYFFRYYYGVFSVLSSDEEFNKLFEASISKHSENKYRIKRATTRDQEQFIRKIQMY